MHLLLHRKRLHTSTGAYNVKWAMHLLRLLYEARRLAKGELPLVAVPEPERSRLLDVRHGRVERAAVEDEAIALAGEVEALQPWPWPAEEPEGLVAELLMEYRRNH